MLEASHTTAPQRVKVYRLNNEGKWDDKGTGHVTIQLLEQANCPGLVVVSEDDHRPLLLHRIAKDDIYHRRAEDTIITWSDTNMGTDIALSFAEDMGCNLIWDSIQRLQQGGHRTDSPTRRRNVDEFEPGYDDMAGGGPGGPISLPPVDLASLPELAKVLSDVSFLHRETLSGQLLSLGYPQKVLELFKQCEDLEDLPSLHQLHAVVKGMILLGDTTLLEALFTGNHFEDVVGALEYEPGLAHPPRHRQFLRDTVVFKEVIPIADPAVKQRIHQTYNIGYIKDVVLPRVLDDQTFAAMSSLLLFYNHDVLTSLQADPAFFPDLLGALRNCPPSEPRWRDLVRLLQELCAQAKHLQPNHRQQLLSKLVSLGLFEVIGMVLQHGDATLQNKAVDILLSSVSHDPTTLRSHMLQESGRALFSQLLQLMIDSSDAGLQEQILEMMRMLLDPENDEQPPEKDNFLEQFYGEPMDRLVQPLADHPAMGEASVEPCRVRARTLGVIVELLCFCVQHHGYRIKFYVLKHNVVAKVLKLLGRREAWLVVTAIRFLRACVALKDDFYNRHITRFNLFGPLFDVFLANGDRYNLLNSAVLDLMEYIRRENIKVLIESIVTEYFPRLESVDYVDTFRSLKTRFEQNHEQETSGVATTSQPATQPPEAVGRETRGLDRGEEDYFAEEDGNEAAPAADAEALPPLEMPTLPRLVDYDEEDDDDDLLAGRTAAKQPPDGASSPPVKRARTQTRALAQDANGHAQGKSGKISLSIKTQGLFSRGR